MRSHQFLFLVACAAVFFAISPTQGADKDSGALSEDMIQNLRSHHAAEPSDAAMYNALADIDISKLAVDRKKVIEHNTIFDHVIKTKGITNQKSSGRCWLFAGLNVMRPIAINKLDLGSFTISTNYLFFWDKLEKANTFLQEIIDTRDRPTDDRLMEILLENPFPDGGWWSYVVDLIQKYGIVPSEVMPETYSTSHTGSLNKLVSRKMRLDAAILRGKAAKGARLDKLESDKEKMLQEVYDILALNFGEPPQTFEWRYQTADSVASEPKEYTPKEFYHDVVGLDLPNYVPVIDYPGKEYFKLYQIEYSRNIYNTGDATFINLPVDSLKRYALASVLDDDPVWFACDVGKSHYGDKGILEEGIYDYPAVYNGINFHLTKQQQLELRDSSPNHAMVFTGVDTTDGVAAKWKVENSWGSDKGDNGYWTLYDDWFNQNVYIVAVDSKYIPQEVLNILKTKPTLLPAWDPMYSVIRSMQ